MELILLVVIPFFLVVACAWYRFRPKFALRPIPVMGLGVVVTGSVLGSEFFSIAGPIPITLDRILIATTVGLFGLLLFLGRENLREFNRADLLILLLMGVIFLSTVTHNWKFLGNMPASRLLFFNLLPLAVYWVMRSCELRRAELKFIATVFGFLGIYLALTAVAEVKEFSAIVFPRYIMNAEFQEFLGRGRGPFLNPVSNGNFMTACFCCLLMWWPRSSVDRKSVVALVALVLVIGVYATLTRSVWVGFVAACGLFIWLPANRPAKGAMVFVATIVVIVASPFLAEKIFSFKRDKAVSQADMEQSAQLRPLFAIVAWNMFKDRPVMGCGFGQYANAKYPYLQDPHSGKPLSATKTLMQHNVFLAYVTETGLIGLACLVLMLVQMAKVSWEVWSDRSLNLWARQFGLLSLVILSGYFVNGMFHDVSIIPMQHMLMFFVFGLVNNIFTKQSAFALGAVEEPEPGFQNSQFNAGQTAGQTVSVS